jgi:hypothetical protein
MAASNVKLFPLQPLNVLLVRTNKWKFNKMELAKDLLLFVLNPEFWIQPVLNASALLIQSIVPPILVNALPDSLGMMIAQSALNHPLLPVLKVPIVKTLNALNV